MNRLQKKCFIASAGFHLLLLLILFVGPAFFSGNTRQDTQVLTFFDLSKVTDGQTGGGNPTPTSSPPPPREIIQPQQSQPPQQIVKPRDPATAPPEREVKSNEKNPFADKQQKRKIEVSTTPVIRSHTKPENNSTRDDSDAKAREAAKLAAAFRNAASGLKNNLSKTAMFQMPPGNGGEASVNWAQAVVSVYYDAWIPPDELSASEDVNTKVSVTIAANGDVISARIIKPSGNSAADSSVQRALNGVKSTAPIPASSKDKERTITIIFNPIVKKQAG